MQHAHGCTILRRRGSADKRCQQAGNHQRFAGERNNMLPDETLAQHHAEQREAEPLAVVHAPQELLQIACLAGLMQRCLTL